MSTVITKNINGPIEFVQPSLTVQVSLVIRGRYVPLFWTANTEFADKKTQFDMKFGIVNQFLKYE